MLFSIKKYILMLIPGHSRTLQDCGHHEKINNFFGVTKYLFFQGFSLENDGFSRFSWLPSLISKFKVFNVFKVRHKPCKNPFCISPPKHVTHNCKVNIILITCIISIREKMSMWGENHTIEIKYIKFGRSCFQTKGHAKITWLIFYWPN